MKQDNYLQRRDIFDYVCSNKHLTDNQMIDSLQEKFQLTEEQAFTFCDSVYSIFIDLGLR